MQPTDVTKIQESFKRHFRNGDHLWLFGSRADMSKRGGDIDLYIETSLTADEGLYDTRLKFSVDLQILLGEQKIDIVIRSPKLNLPIYEVALKEGVLLV